MDEISVKDLAVKTREAMRANGVAEYSLWKQYTNSLAKRRNAQRFTLSDDETVKKLYGLV